MITERHLIDWHKVEEEEWVRQIEAAMRYHQGGMTWEQAARGKSLALLFFNSSLRTRTSMELAAAQLGAHSTTITPGQGTWSFAWDDGVLMEGVEAEHIHEAVGVLSRYYDALGVRVFASMNDYEKDRNEVLLNRFIEAATVPVINMESAFYHPCQALGDAATLMTHFDRQVAGRRFVLAWTYHPKALPMAVPNSALLMAARLGMQVTVAAPATYALDAGVLSQARSYAARHGTTVEEVSDMDAAFEGADVVYAKAWGGALAYADPLAEDKVRKQYRRWRVTEQRMALTNQAAFMHCLPVRRNVVVDDSVLDGPAAIHLLQAEFRLHAQKAILASLWGLDA
jgi:N-acetylornithine carbamoyltransferase